jgi:hypothetical protein
MAIHTDPEHPWCEVGDPEDYGYHKLSVNMLLEPKTFEAALNFVLDGARTELTREYNERRSKTC